MTKAVSAFASLLSVRITVMLKIHDDFTASTWRHELRSAIRTPRVLGEFLELPEEFIAGAERAQELLQFPFLVPWSFANRMQPRDMSDPLLLQIWPQATSDSLDKVTATSSDPGMPEFVEDPVGDLKAVVVDGLLHKYTGRVLMVTTGACAVHCRYCFRQNFPYSQIPHQVQHWKAAIEYIQSDPTIHEVILSGGDPLTVRDHVLGELVELLQSIPHVTRLRIHSRLPIVLPSRINEEFAEWFANTRLSRWFVIHCNHAKELSKPVIDAIRRLRAMDCVVLNQAVLLRGVNDNLSAQHQLWEKLVDIGVLPYYLHQIDRVRGSERFEVSESFGKTIIDGLRKVLPGYAVPKYVREISGEASKSAID